MRAWIEINYTKFMALKPYVALFMRAWIEMELLLVRFNA